VRAAPLVAEGEDGQALPMDSAISQLYLTKGDLSPNFPPLKSRALGCRHAHRDSARRMWA
jgi:hypothetical protein